VRAHFDAPVTVHVGGEVWHHDAPLLGETIVKRGRITGFSARNGNQIVQGPGYVAFRNEMIHESRVIPLDGRPHVSPAIKMVMGDSRGHWEGNDLVVETTNFTDKDAIGSNGAGKTTVIETLAGMRPLGERPQDGGPVVTGKLRTGHNVTIGYLSQHAEELSPGAARTVLESAQHATGLTPNKARALLGQFLFSGEEAEKPLDGLSGGERRRLSLAILMNGKPNPPNVLILDEPTNHLDLESREALEQALAKFPGSLLLISHDRALLDAVGTRTVALEDGTLHSYVGGWPEYLRAREDRAQRARGGAGVAGAGAARATGDGRTSSAGSQPRPRARRKGSPGNPPKAQPSSSARAKHSQRRLEREIEQAEAELRALEDELADPAAWASQQRSTEAASRHEQAKDRVDELMRRWEQVAS